MPILVRGQPLEKYSVFTKIHDDPPIISDCQTEATANVKMTAEGESKKPVKILTAETTECLLDIISRRRYQETKQERFQRWILR
jgi:hypothetical protein